MASPDSEGEIPDTPPEDQSSFRRDHDGRSALPASGRNDRDPTQGAEGDASSGKGRRAGRPLHDYCSFSSLWGLTHNDLKHNNNL